MIARNSQSGHTTYGLQEFTVDTEADVKMLPLDIPMGSTALCVETGAVYILNGNKEWKLFGGSSSPSGGGVSKEYVDTQVATKQDILRSGENIKTINNESILGEGNININPDVIVSDEGQDYKVTFELRDGQPILVTVPVGDTSPAEEEYYDTIPENDWNDQSSNIPTEPIEAETEESTSDAEELPE